MAKKRKFCIAAYVWATLIGAVSTVTSFAAERHSSMGVQSSRPARGSAMSQHRPAGAATGATAKGAGFRAEHTNASHAGRATQEVGGRQGLKGSAAGSGAPQGQGAVAKGVNLPAIDTRGAVESRAKAPAKMQVIKIAPQRSPRPVLRVAPANGLSRNAIGVPVMRPARTPPGGGETFALRPSVPERSTAVGLAKVEVGIAPKGLPPPKPLNSPGLNRATINGTRFTRPALAPSAIGGPATIVGGINGSAMRSKR